MRRTILVTALIPVLVLAACGENSGWNPNYHARATPYGDYLRARENALMGRREDPPRIVPVALPVKAPTPEQIAGHSLRPVPEATLAKVRRPAGAPSIDPYPTEPVLATVPVGTGKAVVVTPAAARPVTATPVVVTPVMQMPVAVTPVAVTPVAVTPIPVAPVAVVRAAPALQEYARVNMQAPGTRVYARPVGYGAVNANPQACAAYPDPTAAQTAFLAQGGPAVDPLGLDPDGDGFVCGWNPAPYRSAVN